MFAAVDTNFLLGLAGDDEDAIDAIETLRRRAPGAIISATPTVLAEMRFLKNQRADSRLRVVAAKALVSFKAPWGFHSALFTPEQQKRAVKVGDHLRSTGLIPVAERHDSFIVVEAALIGASLLVTDDSVLRGMDYPLLVFELGRFKLHPPVLATAREIVHKFFQ